MHWRGRLGTELGQNRCPSCRPVVEPRSENTGQLWGSHALRGPEVLAAALWLLGASPTYVLAEGHTPPWSRMSSLMGQERDVPGAAGPSSPSGQGPSSGGAALSQGAGEELCPSQVLTAPSGLRFTLALGLPGRPLSVCVSETSLFGSLSSNFGVCPWRPSAPGLCPGSPTIPARPVAVHRVVLTVDFSVPEQEQRFFPFSAWTLVVSLRD